MREVPAIRMSKEPTCASKSALLKLFLFFFLQLILIILASFIAQDGPVFVVRKFFGLDYYDFVLAGADWLGHADPYLRLRLFTPPSSIALGLMLKWIPFVPAALVFMTLNIAAVGFSIHTLARQFGLNSTNKLLLGGITLTFYPFYFLIERGNLDGIMLALLVFGFASRHWIVRAFLIGASVAIKVYSGLLIALMLLRKGTWKVIVGATLTIILLQIPFWHLLPNFVNALRFRSGYFRVDENISPAVLFWDFLDGRPNWSLVFLLFWLATLLQRVMRDRNAELAKLWPAYVPWMISFPMVVYPYSGVLALALVTMIAGRCQERAATHAEKVVLIGFALLGFQAVAWTNYLSRLTLRASQIHMVCSVGTMLMMIGSCLLSHESQNTIESRIASGD